ncbi:MAG: UDP-N-acetylmuramoyl-L-alanyl-D-glutamate--2,6-diaminopimelate ligase [Ignavibacteriae bacterium]|nr:MAG: UDP-N-acetylmuramoyl-L-alanyl-D-glutamate--2,6-diaminopimelate ligase [Ignavibacteriota bacterium]
MLLNQLLNNVSVIQTIGKPELVEIKNITLNSKEVKNKSLFVAIKGFKIDGHKFIPEAVSKGAKAVVVETDSEDIDSLLKLNDVTKILVKNSRIALAQLSNSFFNYPSSKLNLIGITGTKGKTTTTYFIKNIFETAGEKTGLIGTNKNIIDNVEVPTKMTTPESNVINELLSKMVKTDCTNCVMEVSSHSLDLHRVDDLDFNVGIFTNLTSDHLDYHNNTESYLKAKKILFDNLKAEAKVIYNKDDEYSKEILKDCKSEKISYGINPKADLQIKTVEYDLNGTTFSLEHKGKDYKVETKLIGVFNVYNAAAAIGGAINSGVDIDTAIKGVISTPQVPGRFEVLSSGNKKVIIDYSHTADSLRQALESINHIVKDKCTVYTVFGCGGDRDKTKRPIMGRIAEENSDVIIITSDNPRTEEPLSIIEDIKKGLKGNSYKTIPDREEAIKEAIEKSEESAVILIAGKGHETYQEINGVRNYFSDKETASKYL